MASFYQMLLKIIVTVLAINVSAIKAAHLYYNFTVSYIQGAPDGVTVDILAVNGQFPGPEIRCKLGDTVHVQVNNQIKDRKNKAYPLSVHWHGLLMYGTVFADGPDHITQCPIKFGKSYEYVFTANQTGTYWWHSHTTWQYSEGMWGVLIIDGPNEPYKSYYPKKNDITITLNDWYHLPGRTNTDWYLSRESGGRSPMPDSALINGKGFYPCHVAAQRGFPCTPQTPDTYEVRRGEIYRFRIINTSAFLTYQFSIQEHRFNVIEADGVDTVPVGCDTLLIAPAQRYSVLVKLEARLKSFGEEEFLIKADVANQFSVGPNINPFPQTLLKNSGQPRAILKYLSEFNNGVFRSAHRVTVRRAESVDLKPTLNNFPVKGTPQKQLEYLLMNPTELRPGQEARSTDESLLKVGQSSYVPHTNYNSSLADFTIKVVTSASQFFGIQTRGFTNKTGKLDPPMILLNEKDLSPADGIQAPRRFDLSVRLSIDFIYDPNTEIVYATFNEVRFKATGKPIIFRMLQKKGIPKSVNPIKIKNAQVVQVVLSNPGSLPHPFHLHGHTFWVVGSGPIGGDVNWTLNGTRRDTVVVDGFTDLYIRFVADNPGAWLFHCHINWHHQAGLAAVFIESPAQASKLYETIGVPKSAVSLCEEAGVQI